MENVSIILKSKTRTEMKEDYMFILKDRELLAETDGEGESFTVRFKIGDGQTPYHKLPYISSLYALFPHFSLCNNAYTFNLDLVMPAPENLNNITESDSNIAEG